MKRLPTMDEQEHGHDAETATLAGDTDALDMMDALALRDAFWTAFPEFPRELTTGLGL